MGGGQRDGRWQDWKARDRHASRREHWEFKTEQRIQIAFSYKGVECRELLSPRPVTQTTVNLAGGLRAVGVHAGALASGPLTGARLIALLYFKARHPEPLLARVQMLPARPCPQVSMDNSAARLIAALN